MVHFHVLGGGVKEGESGALRCMGQIRSLQFLGKLCAVYAPEKAGIFLVWQTLIQHTKLQNVCNCIEKVADMCFASAFETYSEKLLFLILTQNKGSAFSNFHCKEASSIKATFGSFFFQPSGIFQPSKMKYFENTCVGQARSCIVGAFMY